MVKTQVTYVSYNYIHLYKINSENVETFIQHKINGICLHQPSYLVGDITEINLNGLSR